MEVSSLSYAEIKLLANVLRGLSIDQVESANSGHPGLPLGCADIVAVLFCKFLRFNPKNSKWPLRDRFVLSAGHGSALLYSALALFTDFLSIEDLKSFRKLGSGLAGHPESHLLEGVEATTGPLGQGVANSVGLALAAKLYGARNPNFTGYRVFCLCSDGDLMEGISYEACSLAGFLGLDNLILMYDDNKISLAGPTSVCFTEDVAVRFRAFGWEVYTANGHDYREIDEAFQKVLNSGVAAPKLIIFRTEIGYCSPKANTHEVHGSPLGKDNVKVTKINLGLDLEEFYVPQSVVELVSQVKAQKLKQASYIGSESSFVYPMVADITFEEFVRYALEITSPEKGYKDASRNTGSKMLEYLASKDQSIVGGSADLEPSTKAYLKGSSDINSSNFLGRNIRFGVREHAMAGIANGLALSGFFKPFVSTFLCFLDYLKPSLRLSALSELPVLYIFTHDSVFLGEDGPTHQPIEHLSHLRSIPNLVTFRPSNPVECAYAYWWWHKSKSKPCVIILSRQSFDQSFYDKDLTHLENGYSKLISCEKPLLTVISTGSEVEVAFRAIKQLGRDDIDLFSVFSFELLLEKSGSLRDIFQSQKIVFVEASSLPSSVKLFLGAMNKTFYFYGIETFGASGSDKDLAEYFGFTPDKFARFLKDILEI